ncbi:helix-turn-helix domain-containing protein [Tenacibaculum maritimum]|nr:helix-turn-helix domain-containing protein [Tenacibaculum maritimum]
MNKIILSSINKEELVQMLTGAIEEILQNKKEKEDQRIVVSKKLGNYLTIKEVLEICKVKSKSTLWNWQQKGKLIPKKKSGRKPLYLKQDVEDFLNIKEDSF